MNFTKGKIVFVGDMGVGKTSIIFKYMNSTKPILPTVAGNSMPIDVQFDNGKIVKLNVWDTSGSENYQCLVPMYARTSQVAIVVFDITNEESFEHVEGWIKYLNTNSNTPNIFLVGNKLDCENTFFDYNDKSEDYANEKEMKLFFTSAKTGQNIDLLFEEIATIVDTTPTEPQPKPIVFNNSETNQQTDGCGC